MDYEIVYHGIKTVIRNGNAPVNVNPLVTLDYLKSLKSISASLLVQLPTSSIEENGAANMPQKYRLLIVEDNTMI